MWAVKLQGPRQGQLSPRTTATIVYMFAYTCVHGPSAPRCKLCGWICVLCVDLGKRVKTPLMKISGMSVIHACIFTRRRISSNSKYWLETYCPVYNLNFSIAYFFAAACLSLMGFWPTFSLIWENELAEVCCHFARHDQQLLCFHMKYAWGFLGMCMCALFSYVPKIMLVSFLLFKVRHFATLHHVAATLHHIVFFLL